MKKFSLALLLLFPVLLFGQSAVSNNFSFEIGSPHLSVATVRTQNSFTDKEGNLLIVKTNILQITIQKFNSETLTETSRNVYTLEDGCTIQQFLKTKDKLFCLYSKLSKSNITSLYSKEINLADGKLNADGSLLIESNGKVAYFRYIESPDSSKILILAAKTPAIKNDVSNYAEMGFSIFTTSLNKISSTEIKMPLTEIKMQNLCFFISNTERIFFLSYLPDSKIFELNEVAGNIISKSSKLNLDPKYGSLAFKEMKMTETKDGNLACTGYYVTDMGIKMQDFLSWSGQINMNGIMRIVVSKDGVLQENFMYDFPVDLINQYEPNKSKVSSKDAVGKIGIRDLQLSSIIENEDGSSLIIGETKFFEMGMQYYCSTIIVSKFNKSGTLLWIIKIPKMQNLGIENFNKSGFTFISEGNTHYILFVDNPKNAAITSTVEPKFYINTDLTGSLVSYKIDDLSGKFSRETILDIKNINGTSANIFMTSRFIKTSKNTFLLEVPIPKNQDALIKMKIH